MNPANLPFDSEAMLQGLRTWVECESPTWDAAAVNRMMDIASRELVIAGTPYVLVYRADPDVVRIIRFLHGAQRWPPRA